MDAIVPWKRLCALIAPRDPTGGKMRIGSWRSLDKLGTTTMATTATSENP
jgi:hypothetical protein